MKISTPQSLLFTLVLSGMGFVAVGLNSSASPNQGATQATRLAQQGYGDAPHQPLAATQACVRIQQGYGHAPYPRVGPMLGDCVAKN